MLDRLTIRTRLVLLSSALLLVVVGTNAYLTRKLADNSASVVAAAERLAIIESASGARVAFGDMRYWLTDLAVSLLTLSETNAAAAQARMEAFLDQLEPTKPQRVATVRAELKEFQKYAAEAVDAYTNE